MGGYISPIIWVWPSSASPSKIWLRCVSERRSPPAFGNKTCSNLGKDLFFLVFTWIRGKKVFQFWWSFFFGLHVNSWKKSVSFLAKTIFCFWSSLDLLTWRKWWLRFIPPMLRIGQNWGKVANYPPQCSTKICTPAFNSPSSQVKSKIR